MSYTNENGEVFAGQAIVHNAPATAVVTVPNLRLIDSLAGARTNFVCVMHPTGNKKPGSIAERNYPLYGQVGKPTVTVAAFLATYPVGNGGVTRARASLLWDLQRGFVTITNANGDPILTVAKADKKA